ncbi:hypothetical protein [Kordia sp.]|uniref:hypothetical protein n=1 Tax=Kordia sp. TaxID=1965332 RepID=UPI003D2C3C2D
MKNITEILHSLFLSKIKNLSVTERFEKLIIKGSLDSEISISEDHKRLIENFFRPLNDRWVLLFFINEGEPYAETNNCISDDFVFKLSDVRPFEDDALSFKFVVQKNILNGACNVYDFSAFSLWVKNLSPLSFLNSINKTLTSNLFVNFNIIEQQETNLFTERVRVNDQAKSQKELNSSWEYFHFDNSKNYPYKSADFKITSKAGHFDELENKLIILRNLFSLTSILDVTYLREDSLNFQLHGLKRHSGEVLIDNLDEKFSIYAEINEWVYASESNISDKIGLVRNIISMYKKEESLAIDNSAYDSIISGYKIYLKENISKYIEVRGKLNDEVSRVLIEIRESLNELTVNYQKSNFLYISFFLSVFILRTMNKVDFQDVFTKDATIMFLSLLVISFIYLIYSVILVLTNRNRIKNRYEKMKLKNTDLLTEGDISKILNDDDEFKSELKYANRKIIGFIILWIVTMVIFYGALKFLSESI